MATKRSIPTTLFASPDFFELGSDTTRLIMIGLILDADDAGRGSAHSKLLARKLDKEPEQIEQALVELEEHGILQCYEVQGRRYYWLCHWGKYQSLSKPTPSQYPAPPKDEHNHHAQQHPGTSHHPQGNAGQSNNPLGNRGLPTHPLESFGQSWETHLEGEGEEEEEQELEEKRTEEEVEDAGAPPNVVLFPSSDDGAVSLSAQKYLAGTTTHVARILRLPVTDELTQIVQEFLNHSTLSVEGEALEAREWIDNARRNHTHKAMTPAFFRRWLKRERGDYGQPLSWQQQATGTDGRRRVSRAPSASQQEDDDPYREYVLRLTRMHAEQHQQRAQEGRAP